MILGSDAGWSSLAARRAHNPKVTGSNPVPATKRINKKPNSQGWAFCFSGFTHVVHGALRDYWTIVFAVLLLNRFHDSFNAFRFQQQSDLKLIVLGRARSNAGLVRLSLLFLKLSILYLDTMPDMSEATPAPWRYTIG